MTRKIFALAVAIGLIVILLGIVAALLLTPEVPEPAEPEQVSPAAASAAEVELARLEGDGEAAHLSAIELTSLIRYRPEVWALGAVVQPTVQFVADTVVVTGSVVVSELPSQPELDAIRFLLPDTAEIRFAGTLHPIDQGEVALKIATLEIAGMPIPAQYYPLILEQIRGRPASGVPPDAVLLPFPRAVGTARIEDGELVLSP